ncbi:MAG: hypothetical protein HKL91_09515 [Candidatus Eremiobacteraeota bacterium]|uniref:Uncharacterized protein n=1 Tax=mine drainage metagenome TaxID=410659 RepID=E6PGB6_9ZZZZ|nr:hypothetical protein [Candidatus Eremiobacteraeota bacterium]
MIGRRASLAAATACMLLLALAAAPKRQDSQLVLDEYVRAMASLAMPTASICNYSISQAGPVQIEQQHLLYRQGDLVRDSLLSSQGIPVRAKSIVIAHRADRYAIDRLAPTLHDYEVLFLSAHKVGANFEYRYQATALAPSSRFSITGFTIASGRFLPSAIAFTSSANGVRGHGAVLYHAVGQYWVPYEVYVTGSVHGKAANERIVWSNCRFPRSLPETTFRIPQPLPSATLPPI